MGLYVDKVIIEGEEYTFNRDRGPYLMSGMESYEMCFDEIYANRKEWIEVLMSYAHMEYTYIEPDVNSVTENHRRAKIKLDNYELYEIGEVLFTPTILDDTRRAYILKVVSKSGGYVEVEAIRGKRIGDIDNCVPTISIGECLARMKMLVAGGESRLIAGEGIYALDAETYVVMSDRWHEMADATELEEIVLYVNENTRSLKYTPVISSYMKKGTLSGDAMHAAYEAAGAVWDGTSWTVNGYSGLSNEEVRKMYNRADMPELLFRKMWNIACRSVSEAGYGRYNEDSGYYELNGILDMTYEEALSVYVNTSILSDIGYYINASSISDIVNTVPCRTTIPCRCGCVFVQVAITKMNIECLAQSFRSLTYTPSTCVEESRYSLQVNGMPMLRCIRDVYDVENLKNNYGYATIASSQLLKYISIQKLNKQLNMYDGTGRLTYYSYHYVINNAQSGAKIVINRTDYSYITGELDPTTLYKGIALFGEEPYIPYEKNSKVIPVNVYWREERPVKGINGSYVYPSFEEYYAENQDNFATAEDWQALATLAEEKGVTIMS